MFCWTAPRKRPVLDSASTLCLSLRGVSLSTSNMGENLSCLCKNKCLLLLVLPFATVTTSTTPYSVHQQKAPTLRIKPPACTCIYARETMNRGMRRTSSEQPNDPGRLCPEHCSECHHRGETKTGRRGENMDSSSISSRHDTQAFFIPNLIQTGSIPFTVLASHNNVCTAKTFRVLYRVQIVPFHLIQHSFVW